MMKRPICHWIVLAALIVSFLLCQAVLAAEQYIIKRGDTLAKISKKFHISVRDLRSANRLEGSALKINGTLIIPAGASIRRSQSVDAHAAGDVSASTVSYAVKRGDNLYSIAKEKGVSAGEIKRLNRLRSNKLQIGQNLDLPETRTEETSSGKEQQMVALSGKTKDEWNEGEDPIDDELGPGVPGTADGDPSTGTDILGAWNSIIERQLLVKVAKGFIGAPYRLGGSSVQGVDCSGFVKKIYDMFNIILPRTARDQSHVGRYVARGDLEEGDLVFFRNRRSISHVGIYVGNSQFVHAASGRQRMVCVSSLNEPYYSARYAKAVRLKGLDEGI